MERDPTTNAAPADESIPASSPPSDAPTGAETSATVASLAGRYMDFTTADLIALSCSDQTGELDAFTADIRSMAASLNRQVQP